MSVKSMLSATGNGLLTAATVISNSTINTEIREIEDEIAELEERKAKLEAKLIKY